AGPLLRIVIVSLSCASVASVQVVGFREQRSDEQRTSTDPLHFPWLCFSKHLPRPVSRKPIRAQGSRTGRSEMGSFVRDFPVWGATIGSRLLIRVTLTKIRTLPSSLSKAQDSTIEAISVPDAPASTRSTSPSRHH